MERRVHPMSIARGGDLLPVDAAEVILSTAMGGG
jgi:hypothetical protein